MILTYKIKHGRDFSRELGKAREVAKYALEYKSFSSKDVKHIGLKSVISNQILRKYSGNQELKHIHKVNLCIPNQGIRVDKAHQLIQIPSLKLELPYRFPNTFTKINQIELNSEYAFVSVSIPEAKELTPKSWLGIDLNTTGHVAVMANPGTGAVTKLGKSALHIHNKYKNIRRKLQRQGKFNLLKRIKNRESRIVKDMNHKISNKIVNTAKEEVEGIKLEKLKGIRETAKSRRTFRYSLHSWSFYQLQQMIEYKAKLLGVPIEYVDPGYTSQTCSRCGLLGDRKGKGFKCSKCGHVDHADANAAFNIAARPSIDQFMVDRDAMKGCTGTPKAAMMRTPLTAEPPML